MSGALTRFRVVSLHGRRSLDIPIIDNRLVIVGENGTGKSTTANMVYYFLTRQWGRLREYKFSAIEAVVGGTEFTLTAEQLELFRDRRLPDRIHSSAIQRALFRFTAEHELEEVLESRDAVARLAYELGVSERRARELIVAHLNEPGSSEWQEMTIALSKAFSAQVLYLPTYRRIEQDLKSIFRGIDVERQFRERLAQTRITAAYVELVEFGMEDVERTINARMSQIKEGVRTALNNLTGTYLRDVIRGVHTNVGVDKLQQITPPTLELMFARLDEATLPQRDKDRVKRRVADMLGKSDVDNEDRVIALFLAKLLELYKTQEQAERDVREFVRVCNEYLVGKTIVYDDANYRITIRHIEDHPANASLFPAVYEQDEERLELKMLSSGEKQIVSLFSHLYFSGGNDFFVIIDEPELSLSVPWQRRFLPDILRSGVTTGLLAVTHSPFIWENELEPYVHSLSEFVEQTHAFSR